MRILGIAILKNESDVVGSFLNHVSTWADRVFVYDNGSTDGTWEIVQAMASNVIVPWKSEDIPFHNGLRARVFNEFSHEAKDGDWWCDRMDADEFYLEDPRKVLAELPAWADRVARKSINYRISQEDLAEYEFTGEFEKDRKKIRYFAPKWGVEARFVRHHHFLVWREEAGASFKSADPLFPLITSQRMIFVQHYQYRSPQQIQRRLETRHEYKYRKAVKKGRIDPAEQSHAGSLPPDAWKRQCPPRSDLIEDTGYPSYQALQPPKGMKHVHETMFSHIAKRLCRLARPLVRALRPLEKK